MPSITKSIDRKKSSPCSHPGGGSGEKVPVNGDAGGECQRTLEFEEKGEEVRTSRLGKVAEFVVRKGFDAGRDGTPRKEKFLPKKNVRGRT